MVSFASAIRSVIDLTDLPQGPQIVGHVDDIERFVSPQDVDELLGARLSRETVQVAMRGRSLPESSYCAVDDVMPHGLRDVHVRRDKVLRLVRQGATCVLGRADLLLPAVEDVVVMLEDHDRLPWKATMFITGPDSAGLNEHLDGESVLVIQLAGEKEWRVSAKPVTENAMLTKQLTPEDTAGMDIETWTLRAGDLAWVPRGHMHACRAGSGGSVHVSIALEPFTAIDVVREVLDNVAAEDPELRAQLPQDYWMATDDHRNQVATMLRRMADRVEDPDSHLFANSIDGLYQRLYWSSRRGESGSLADALSSPDGKPLRRLAVLEDADLAAYDVERLIREVAADGTLELSARDGDPGGVATLTRMERAGAGTPRSNLSRA